MTNTDTNWNVMQRLGDLEMHKIIQSEIEGGVFLQDLPQHTVLEIQTSNRCYTAEVLGPEEVLISGHPRYCPEPVHVGIVGSSWGGSLLKVGFVGRGMHLEIRHPDYEAPIITSKICEIRECS